MGIRSILKKKGDGDSDEDRSQSPTNGFFQYQNQNQNQNQNQYQNLSQNPYQDEYRDQYQSQQQSPSYHHHQQQQQRGGPPPRPPPPAESLQTPEFTFIRSDTFTQEVIHPPSWPANSSNGNGNGNLDNLEEEEGGGDGRNHLQIHELPATPVVSPRGRNFDVFRRSSHSSRSASSQRGDQEKDNENHHDQLEPEKPAKDKDLHRLSRKLSARLHLHRSSGAAASTHVPANLPEIVVPEGEGGTAADAALALSGGGGAAAGATSPTAAAAAATSAKNKKPPPANPAIESQWEKRATLLALENEKRHIYNTAAAASLSRPTTPEKGKRRGRSASSAPAISPAAVATASAAATVRSQQQNGGSNTKPNDVSSKELDATIQEAIRLHEEGQLEESTRLFGILADPRGHNNPLSQVLYGLALRHGWGCEPDTEAAVTYLSAAASNAAAVEELALQAGLKRGGAAKGELVLAIFELANCFRHGWGLEKDPIAAKQYYETAANLGDTDAMNEVAWCYLEGFGCKKDKFAASRYYRLAEQNGNKTLGNTWIWKEKYDPEKQKPKKK